MDDSTLRGHTADAAPPIAWTCVLERWLGDGAATRRLGEAPGDPMAATEELFRDDAYLRECTATVTAVDGAGIPPDRTVFYPTGGRQPGDSGVLKRADGSEIAITDTRKGDAPGETVPLPAAPPPLGAVDPRTAWN